MAWLKDPGGLFLRRALRVAVVLPVTYFFTENVLHLQYGSGIASFTSYALLGLADFGGPPRSRATAYVVTGLVGLPLIILGSLLSGFLVVSILAAGVVAFAVNYSGVLRGYFTAAGTSLLLPFVMAVTSPPGTDVMAQLCVGYAIGVVVSLVAALVLWPSYLGSNLRQATAQALHATADEVAIRWIDGGSTHELSAARHRTATALADVHAMYDGALGRPGPGTGRDRSLVAVLSELDRVDRILQWQVGDSAEIDPLDANLARTVVQTFKDAAAALSNPRQLPDPGAVNDSREEHQILIEDRVNHLLAEGRASESVSRESLSELMHLRIVALSAQSIAGNVIGAVGAKVPEGSAAVTLGGQQLWDPVNRLGPRHYLVSQFRWHSPWVRNAIRTGAAIAIATAIVQITDLPHGMWIVLGTLVALRFDAGGTSRTAASVLVGTVVGFALASAVIYLVGTDDVVLWVLFPISVFLAAYTPNSISLMVGQATFTVYGVILYALYLPTGYTTAEFRLFNVFIALVVSLVVSALLWPRGVVPLVETTLQSAAARAGSFLVDAMGTLTRAPGHHNPELLRQDQVDAQRALTLAKQSYDLAYAQKGPGLPDIERWSNSAEAISNVERSAEIVTSVVHHGRTTGGDEESKNALLATAQCIDRSLHSVFAVRESADSEPANSDTRSALEASVDQLQSAVDRYARLSLADPQNADARDLTALIWLADWLQYAAWEVGECSTREELTPAKVPG